MEEYDAIVIGAGQGGSPMASFLAKKNRRVALIERGYVGGTCVNYGCTPTKTWISSAKIAYQNKIGERFAVKHGPVEIDFSEIQKRKNDIVLTARNALRDRLQDQENLVFLKGNASFVSPNRIEVNTEKGLLTLTAKQIFIDTGSSPSIASIPGLERADYLDSNQLLDLKELPQTLIIIGGSYIAVELSQIFARLGVSVVILESQPHLLSKEDEDVSTALRNILTDEGIDVRTGVEIKKVQRKNAVTEVHFSLDGTQHSITGSHLLVALGRTPNTHELNLEKAGIATDKKGYIQVDEFLNTTAPQVFALGDVKGGPAFTHIAYDDFRIVSHNLFNKDKKSIKHRVVPYCVFTDPELGRTGITEKQAIAEGVPHKVAKMPMNMVARAVEAGETKGFMKAIVHIETNQILGAAILGMNGGEVASLLHLAVIAKLPYTLLRDSPFSHPTVSESLNNLFAKI